MGDKNNYDLARFHVTIATYRIRLDQFNRRMVKIGLNVQTDCCICTASGQQTAARLIVSET